MRQIATILVCCLLMACNGAVEKDSSTPEVETKMPTPEKEQKSPQKKSKEGTYLCKINGEDWAYTKASGIISTHAKTKKQTALITFKKKLDKGSEHIQLEYDTNSFELLHASMQLKFKKKNGKLSTCYYSTNAGKKNRHPQQAISGSIDLSNNSVVSGTAEVMNVNIRYEKEELLDSEKAVVSLTALSFSGVGCSDLDKLVNTFKK